MLHLLGNTSPNLLFSKLVITQFSDKVKVKDTSQLINGMSNALQKLLKYFNDTAILTFLCLPYLHYNQDY